MRRLDHSMIFVFIAGTYTPFCVLLLPTGEATLILALVWGGALGGVAMKLDLAARCRAGSSAPLYLALGWVRGRGAAGHPARAAGSPPGAAAAGGVAYSVGAVFYALRRPNPWPTVFGHHEFFHACTLVAAICHHIAIYFALYAS